MTTESELCELEDIFSQCCEQGKQYLSKWRTDKEYWYLWPEDGGSEAHIVRFCPFCGHDLGKVFFPDLPSAIASLLKVDGKGQPIVLDVDGVLADDREGLPYDQRKPYPWVAEFVGALKKANYKIVVATARYMYKCEGDQNRASERGRFELTWWLKENNIPFDQVYLGKPPTETFYVDDKSFRLRSNDGEAGWRSLAAALVAGSK